MKTLNGNEIENPIKTDCTKEQVIEVRCEGCGLLLNECGLCGKSFVEESSPYYLMDEEIYCDVKGMIDNETGADLHFHKICYDKKKLEP